VRKEYRYIYFRLGSPNPILSDKEDQDPKSSLLGPDPKNIFTFTLCCEKICLIMQVKKAVVFLIWTAVSRTCHLADDFLSYTFFSCTIVLSSRIFYRIMCEHPGNQCCGSVKFLCGSGPSDPYFRLTDPDADPGGAKTYGSHTGTFSSFFKDKKS
jgi:hypothetical protein